MKPIEAGCLAIIINGNYPDNIGKTVKVIKLNLIETELMGQNVWELNSVSGPLKVRRDNYTKDFKFQDFSFSLERNLMRIDGGEPKDMIDKRINFLEVDKCQRNYRRVL